MVKVMTQLAYSRKRRGPGRRGVLLLVVLGMLAMFGLIGLAFVMLTGHARRGAEAIRKKEFYVAQPQQFTEEALLQILRGSNNPSSVLQNHGLLEDVYGAPVVPDTPLTANGIDDDANGTPDNPEEMIENAFAITTIGSTANNQLWTLTIPDGWRYVGRVLTMIDGPAKGKSARIVGYNGGIASITAIPSVSLAECLNYINGSIPIKPLHFIINGAPFSGTGFGYNIKSAANDPQLSARLRSWTPADSRTVVTNAAPLAYDPLVALLPNPVCFDAQEIYHYPDPDTAGYTDIPADDDLSYDDPSGPGGANEDYDVPDYQNMLLALQLPAGNVLSPSLHRPALINYWNNQLLTHLINTSSMSADQSAGVFACPLLVQSSAYTNMATDIPLILDLKRRATLRPLQEYHPNFTGSNPNYWPLWDGVIPGPIVYDLDTSIAGPEVNITQPEWDVDNDGDGIKDSIWVDIGLPVQSTKDGRRYKPLVAILCLDLDGRLNLNAHGNLAQIVPDGVGPSAFDTTLPCSNSIANNATPILNRGQGCGPAEVDLRAFFNISDYSRLLLGEWDTVDPTKLLIPGRYGFDGLPGSSNPNLRLTPNIRAMTLDTCWGRPYDFSGYPVDYTGVNELEDHLQDPSDPLRPASDFGSPIDLKGAMQAALDWRGQPVYQTVWLDSKTFQDAPNKWTNTAIDLSATPIDDALVGQPYELDLSPEAPRGSSLKSADAPFSPQELERLLRPYDVDTMNLPDRLEKLVSPSVPNWWVTNNRNRKVTTESWDIASTPCAVTSGILEKLVTDRGATDPVEFGNRQAAKNWLDKFPAGIPQLLAAQIALKNTGMTPTTIETNFATIGEELLGPELMAGLPLDLNRRFAERNPVNPAQNREDRRDMARHLYCLAMLLADLEYLDTVAWQSFVDTDPGTGPLRRKYATRLLAQWAINVVDFRCNDSAMTGFEYDEEPFVNNDTGNDSVQTSLVWDLDNYLDTELDPFGATFTSADDTSLAERGLVWGATRPELLITETLALHDRRTEDLDIDGGKVSESKDTNNDFDQQWKPQGSLFVELYNPWSPNEPPRSDLYVASSSGGYGVNLSAVSTTGGTSPVWRLAITESISTSVTSDKFDLDHPVITERPTPTRAVYFAKDASVTLPTDITDGLRPASGTSDIAPILPGRYALVGPGEPGDTSESTTLFGYRTGINPGNITTTEEEQTRRITLKPDDDPTTTGQVKIFGDGSTNNDLTSAPISGAIQNPTAVIINHPSRLSATEPSGGYPPYNAVPAADRYTDPYPGVNIQQPLDLSLSSDYWNTPGKAIRLSENGTYNGVFLVHLQRLADPTQAHDEHTNPYLTLDAMPVDVTVFNGVATEGSTNNIKLFSRERGEKNNLVANRLNPNPWTQDDPVTEYRKSPIETQPLITKTVASHYLDKDFSHSLGYLNGSYRGDGVPPLNTPVGYEGSPSEPFPWFNWNDRPYVSKEELMLVPCTQSSRLLECFGLTGTNTNQYTPDPPTADSVADRAKRVFPHLPNFFNSSNTPGAHDAAELQRILDYVRVPSRFVKTREPIMDTGFTATEIADQVPEFIRELTDRREPGRVNLNTVVADEVAGGVKTGLTEANLTVSRWSDSTKTIADFDNDYPTRFPNPFRSSGGLGLVPTQELMDAVDREVNATLLRENGGNPLFAGTSTTDYDNTDRNPYFRYNPLAKLGNIAGTRSNVYAVWVTIGYFEAEPAVQIPGLVTSAAELARIYPDGVRIGQEVGADSGEVQRSRAFFMIDRSIPVGFKRGENLNVKDAVLIQRAIE